MQDLAKRIESFQGQWPESNTQTPKQIAEAGFYYTGKKNQGTFIWEEAKIKKFSKFHHDFFNWLVEACHIGIILHRILNFDWRNWYQMCSWKKKIKIDFALQVKKMLYGAIIVMAD